MRVCVCVCVCVCVRACTRDGRLAVDRERSGRGVGLSPVTGAPPTSGWTGTSFGVLVHFGLAWPGPGSPPIVVVSPDVVRRRLEVAVDDYLAEQVTVDSDHVRCTPRACAWRVVSGGGGAEGSTFLAGPTLRGCVER